MGTFKNYSSSRIDFDVEVSDYFGLTVVGMGSGSNDDDLAIYNSTNLGSSYNSPVFITSAKRLARFDIEAKNGLVKIIHEYEYSSDDNDIYIVENSSGSSTLSPSTITDSSSDERIPSVASDKNGQFYYTYSYGSSTTFFASRDNSVSETFSTGNIVFANPAAMVGYQNVTGVFGITPVYGSNSSENAKSYSYSTGGTTTSLSVSPTSLSFNAVQEQRTFSITSNTSWTVTDDASWISVTPTSGSGNGTISVTALQNTSTSSRTATITVSGGGTNRTVSVSQLGVDVPQTPTNLTGTYNGSGVDLSWSGNASSYKVYRKIDSGSFSLLTTTTNTFYSTTALSTNRVYYFQVSGVNSSGIESERTTFITIPLTSISSSSITTPGHTGSPVNMRPRPTFNISNSRSDYTYIEISDEFESTVIESSYFSGSQFQPESNLEYGKNYLLKVAPAYYNEDGTYANGFVTTISFSTFSYPSTASATGFYSFSGDVEESEYRLIGLPGSDEGIPTALSTVFGIDSDQFKAYQMSSFTSSSRPYAEITTVPNQGLGFWFLARDNVGLNYNRSSAVLNGEGQVVIPLNMGYNIITNPFNETIFWSNLTDYSFQPLLTWNGFNYSTASTFEPGVGYFWNNTIGYFEMVIDYYELFVENVLKQTNKKNPSVQNELKLQHRLAMRQKDKSIERVVELGFAQEWSVPKSVIDVVLPPTPFQTSEMFWENESKQKLLKKHLDFNPDGLSEKLIITVKENGIWEFDLDDNLNGTFLETENWNHWLIHENSGRKVDLNQESSSLFLEKGEHSFVYLAGNDAFVDDKLVELIPQEFALHQNYPNPFNPSTVISYSLPNEAQVRLEVYDVMGKRVAELANAMQKAGYHQFDFDASKLASGLYLYRLTAGNQVQVRKMLLVK